MRNKKKFINKQKKENIESNANDKFNEFSDICCEEIENDYIHCSNCNVDISEKNNDNCNDFDEDRNIRYRSYIPNSSSLIGELIIILIALAITPILLNLAIKELNNTSNILSSTLSKTETPTN